MKHKKTKETIKSIVKVIVQFVVNPRLLFCFGVAWMITNGWSYILLGIGTYYQIEWMMALAGGYLAFLWLPISPEKIVTVLLAMLLLRLIFPNDKQTLGILKELHSKYKRKRQTKAAKKGKPQNEEKDSTADSVDESHD